MTVLDELKETLEGIDIRFDEPLKTYTYTKVGGKADYLVFPRNRYEMARVVKFANQENIPWMVLGNASNIIVREGGVRGFVIMCDKFNNVSVDGYTIEAEAGANLIETTRIALRHSLTGFEFACGIPGSVGGAVFMNAGAYGGEIAHVLQSCQILTKEGVIKTLSVKDLAFGYAPAIFEPTSHALAPATHLRALSQPPEYPSCGSVFKRPVGHFAGQLISEAGLKGYRIGGVEVSEKHAGFMINVADGTARDYEDLIESVIEKVREHSGVTLEREVRILGEHE